MQERKVGTLEVTVAGLGCNNFGWRIDAAATVDVVNAALDAGVNFFDTADIYDTGHSEEFLARALGARRKNVVVATKFGMKMGEGKEGAKPEYIRRAVEDSLRRLQTDYIDLYQLHRPDPNVPIADTLGALDELVKAGKVREIGASNFSAAQIREAETAAPTGTARFVSVQNHYSMLHREPEGEVIAECRRLGLALLPYFPLANGLLSGNTVPDSRYLKAAVAKRDGGLRCLPRESRSRREASGFRGIARPHAARTRFRVVARAGHRGVRDCRSIHCGASEGQCVRSQLGTDFCRFGTRNTDFNLKTAVERASRGHEADSLGFPTAPHFTVRVRTRFLPTACRHRSWI